MRFSLQALGQGLLEGLAELRFIGFVHNPFPLARWIPDESADDTELSEHVSYEAMLLHPRDEREEQVD